MVSRYVLAVLVLTLALVSSASLPTFTSQECARVNAQLDDGQAAGNYIIELIKEGKKGWGTGILRVLLCGNPIILPEGGFSWEATPTKGTDCNWFLDAMNRVASDLAASSRSAYHSAKDAFFEYIRTKHGSGAVSFFKNAVDTQWGVCEDVLEERGGNYAWTSFTVQVESGYRLPEDDKGQSALRMEMRCTMGRAGDRGEGILERGSQSLSAAPDKFGAVSCVFHSDGRARSYNGQTCLLGAHIMKYGREPAILVVDESSVSDCPYSWRMDATSRGQVAFIVGPKKAAEYKPTPECQRLLSKIGGKAINAAKHVEGLIASQSSKWEKELVDVLQCLSPIVWPEGDHRAGVEASSWESKPTSETNCPLITETINRVADKLAGEFQYYYNNALEIFIKIVEKAHGSWGQRGGRWWNLYHHLQGVWSLCHYSEERTMGVSNPSKKEWTYITTRIKDGYELPLEDHQGWADIRVKLQCTQGYDLSPGLSDTPGNIRISSRNWIDKFELLLRPQTTWAAAPELNHEFDGLSCQFHSEHKAKSFKGQTCMLSGYYRRLGSLPFHLIASETSVSDCPYTWTVVSRDNYHPIFELVPKVIEPYKTPPECKSVVAEYANSGFKAGQHIEGIISKHESSMEQDIHAFLQCLNPIRWPEGPHRDPIVAPNYFEAKRTEDTRCPLFGDILGYLGDQQLRRTPTSEWDDVFALRGLRDVFEAQVGNAKKKMGLDPIIGEDLRLLLSGMIHVCSYSDRRELGNPNPSDKEWTYFVTRLKEGYELPVDDSGSASLRVIPHCYVGYTLSEVRAGLSSALAGTSYLRANQPFSTSVFTPELDAEWKGISCYIHRDHNAPARTYGGKPCDATLWVKKYANYEYRVAMHEKPGSDCPFTFNVVTEPVDPSLRGRMRGTAPRMVIVEVGPKQADSPDATSTSGIRRSD